MGIRWHHHLSSNNSTIRSRSHKCNISHKMDTRISSGFHQQEHDKEGRQKNGSNIITKSKFESYLSKSTNNNQYAALATSDDNYIKVTIRNSSTPVETSNNDTNPIQISKDFGIADAGATGHFLHPGTPAKNIRPTNNPISISHPDGGKLESTHECEIDNPQLTQAERAAHIVPGLAHTYLVSIKMLIDAGCNVTYNTKHIEVFYKETSCGQAQGNV